MRESDILICCRNSTSAEASVVENIESISMSIDDRSNIEIAVYGYTKIMRRELKPDEAKAVGEMIWQRKRNP